MLNWRHDPGKVDRTPRAVGVHSPRRHRSDVGTAGFLNTWELARNSLNDVERFKTAEIGDLSVSSVSCGATAYAR